MGPCNSHPVSCLLGFGLINSTKHLFDSCPCHMQPHSLPQRKTVCKYSRKYSKRHTYHTALHVHVHVHVFMCGLLYTRSNPPLRGEMLQNGVAFGVLL